MFLALSGYLDLKQNYQVADSSLNLPFLVCVPHFMLLYCVPVHNVPILLSADCCHTDHGNIGIILSADCCHTDPGILGLC